MLLCQWMEDENKEGQEREIDPYRLEVDEVLWS
jgi:hypothetical protein